MKLDLFRPPNTDRLIQEAVRATQDPTKWTAEAGGSRQFFYLSFLVPQII